MSEVKLNVCGHNFTIIGVEGMEGMAMIGPMQKIHGYLEEASMVYLSKGGKLTDLTIRQYTDRLELVREEVLVSVPWPPEIKIRFEKDPTP